MYELKKNGKVFTSKSVGTGPSSCEKRTYRAAVSQRLRNTGLWHVYVSSIVRLRRYFSKPEWGREPKKKKFGKPCNTLIAERPRQP
jgi:hypothetical protein